MAKRGLIMEGGAMLGLFTAGVIDVLMEHGIEFDGAIGVSAGAAFGCNYKSKQIGRALRYNLRFAKDKRYCSIQSLLKTGDIYNKEFCYSEIPLKYDVFDFETYESTPMDFYVVCTDIESGLPAYHKYEGRDDHGFEWVRASASMPVVSNIVEIDGKKYLDGGISDSIPVEYFEKIGYDRNVAILTKPKEYRKKKNALVPVLFKIVYGKYPNFVKTMANRYIMYNNSKEYITERESAGELFVIRPQESLPLKRVEKNPEKLKKAYEIGRETAEKRLDELIAYLNK